MDGTSGMEPKAPWKYRMTPRMLGCLLTEETNKRKFRGFPMASISSSIPLPPSVGIMHEGGLEKPVIHPCSLPFLSSPSCPMEADAFPFRLIARSCPKMPIGIRCSAAPVNKFQPKPRPEAFHSREHHVPSVPYFVLLERNPIIPELCILCSWNKTVRYDRSMLVDFQEITSVNQETWFSCPNLCHSEY